MPKKIKPVNPGREDDWILSGDLEEADFEELGRKNKTTSLQFKKVTSLPARPFRRLAPMRMLKFLCFESCPITPDDMADLAALPKLESLMFERCPVTDEGVTHLRNHPRLWQLVLDRSSITDEALKTIGTISKLTWLWLHDTRITDAGLKHLLPLIKLEDLDLAGTAVTDAGILCLAALPKLKLPQKYGLGTAVTEEGLDAFVAAQRALRKSAKPGAKEMSRATTPKPAKMPQLSEDEIAAAKQTLYAYFKAMNAWQAKHAKRYEKAAKNESFDARPLFDACREDCRQIFAKYCTTKKRAYGRPENVGIGGPEDYPADPTLEPVTHVEPATRSRLVVETKYRGMLEARHRYVLVKKDGRWLLDSKQRWDGGWKWTIL